ncbi:neurexin 1-like [Littorina saxatilis]|uniref:neurexin 1-like n=1 Tax=Littorina saxatilis TaxID=31220 RepID=UPI0038B55798
MALQGRCVPSRTLQPLLLLSLLVIFFTSTAQGLRFLGERETYARYPIWNACQNASISFEFRTRQPTALLLYTDDNSRYEYLQLALTKGAVRLWIKFEAMDSQFVDIEANTEALNDGQWHRVEIRRNRIETFLYVDGAQTSKVSVGSDTDLGLDPTQSNYVHFGGIPSNYRGNLRQDPEGLPQSFFDTKFRGDIRNILYFNCSCIPLRTAMVEGRGVSRDPPEACDLRNPCPVDCPCVSVDDGSGCECKYKRECLKDILASYYLPMDQVEDKTLVNPSGLDSLVEGRPQLTTGVKENALLIDGRSQYLRVTGGGHRRECLGDLARCDKGQFLMERVAVGEEVSLGGGGVV